MWEDSDGPGLLAVLHTRATRGQSPGLGRPMMDSVGQLSSCLVLLEELEELL